MHLKQHSTVFLQTDALSVGQSQQAVVIHDRVHVLHPEGINISIIDNVLAFILVCGLVDLTEDVGQQSIRPVSGGRVQDAVQLNDTAIFGVDGELLGLNSKPAMQQSKAQQLNYSATLHCTTYKCTPLYMLLTTKICSIQILSYLLNLIDFAAS